MYDHVECNNCEFVGTVELGSEKCPSCGKTGTLSWVDDENPEVEDPIED